MIKTSLIVFLVAAACQAEIPKYGDDTTEIIIESPPRPTNYANLAEYYNGTQSHWTVEEDGRCGAGRWYVMENRCYTFVDQPMNFSSAVQMCDQQYPGSYLTMMPHYSNASEFLTEITGENVTSMWTCATSTSASGGWVHFMNMSPADEPTIIIDAAHQCSVHQNNLGAMTYATENCTSEKTFMCSKKICPRSMSNGNQFSSSFHRFFDGFPTIKFVGIEPVRACIDEVDGECLEYQSQLHFKFTVNGAEVNIIMKL